jgi:hypothetical protein
MSATSATTFHVHVHMPFQTPADGGTTELHVHLFQTPPNGTIHVHLHEPANWRYVNTGRGIPVAPAPLVPVVFSRVSNPFEGRDTPITETAE